VFTKLFGLTYKIVYKKGSDNKATNALSRRPDATATCHALCVCQPKWLEQVDQSYETNVFTQDLITKLVVDNTAMPSFPGRMGYFIIKLEFVLTLILTYTTRLSLYFTTLLLEDI
jgi:hypothetical protein